MTDQPAPQTPRTAVIGAVALIEHSVEHDLLDEYLHWVLRHALGHDRCVPAQHCERCGTRMVATPDEDLDNALIRAERAEAERDRLRACLSVLLRDIDEGEVTGGDPECVDLSITVNRADFDEARAALDGKEK